MLYSSFFSVTVEKCKSQVFTRRWCRFSSEVNINEFTLPIVPHTNCLRLTLDSKLHWMFHLHNLSVFTSRWVNFLRSVASTWWRSTFPHCYLIYKSVIRAKIDYGSFLSGSASHTHLNRFNNVETSCLRFIIGALKSVPNSAIEIEAACLPFNIRCRWLADKFILKKPFFQTPR